MLLGLVDMYVKHITSTVDVAMTKYASIILLCVHFSLFASIILLCVHFSLFVSTVLYCVSIYYRLI